MWHYRKPTQLSNIGFSPTISDKKIANIPTPKTPAQLESKEKKWNCGSSITVHTLTVTFQRRCFALYLPNSWLTRMCCKEKTSKARTVSFSNPLSTSFIVNSSTEKIPEYTSEQIELGHQNARISIEMIRLTTMPGWMVNWLTYLWDDHYTNTWQNYQMLCKTKVHSWLSS